MTRGTISLEGCTHGLWSLHLLKATALVLGQGHQNTSERHALARLAQHHLQSILLPARHRSRGSLRRQGAWPGWGTSWLDSHHRSSKKLLGSSGRCHEGLQPLRDHCRDLLMGQVVPLAFVFLAFTAFQSNADFFILERVKRRFSENCFGIIYFSF